MIIFFTLLGLCFLGRGQDLDVDAAQQHRIDPCARCANPEKPYSMTWIRRQPGAAGSSGIDGSEHCEQEVAYAKRGLACSTHQVRNTPPGSLCMCHTGGPQCDTWAPNLEYQVEKGLPTSGLHLWCLVQ